MQQLSNPAFFRLFIIVFLFGFRPTAEAQTTFLPNAYKDFSVTVKGSQGTNGAGLAYNASQGLYYASIAGNESYPLIIFNNQGDLMEQQAIGYDVRGIWYNPKTERLEGNAYAKRGWVAFGMDENAYPTEDVTVFAPGMNQPSSQAVGTIWAKKKAIVFLHNNYIHLHRAKDGAEKKIIELTGIPSSLDDINMYTAIATGVKGYEFGILNHVKKRVYFFNKKGKYTDQCKLPEDAITNDSFRFGYANNRVFLYDVIDRTWTAYQVFK